MMEYMNFMGAENLLHFAGFGGFGLGILVLSLWSIFWKGCALWTAAERREPWWFVALLIINTAGILEIVYLFLITKKGLPHFKEIFKGTTPSSSTTTEQKS